MKQNVLDQAEKYARAHRRRNRWHKVTTVMASVVVFGTTYALILPAITAERTTCGIVEHTHNDSCYREIPAVTRQELVCSEESLNIHEHTKACYDDENSLTCGYADFVVHKHDESCYDESGNLVCTLPEIEAHTHDESCYAQPASAVHVHTEACYSLQPVFLVCAETEGEGHVHTADCYTETTYLSCMFSDVEGHEHGPECYETVTELTCGQTEGGGHQHGEDCYVWDEVLTCEYADVTPEEPELICNKEEIVLHKHTKDCYDEDGNLICGMLEVLEHKHTEDCFQTVVVSEATRELICEKQEHVHDSSCYPETEKITEKQTEEMTETAAETQTEKLTEAETEAQTEKQTEKQTEAESELETEEQTEAESESETEDETELLTEAETEELTEAESESETEEEIETETEEADVLDEEFRLTAQAESGIEVTVSGPSTSLPYPVEEISLTVEDVTDEEVLAIWKQTVEEAGADAEEAFLLNITLWHDGEEIEPTGFVQVTFTGMDVEDDIEDDSFAVFHIDVENENAEDMNAVLDEEGAVVLDTDHFSTYGGLVKTSGVTRKPQPEEYIYLDLSALGGYYPNEGYTLGFYYHDSNNGEHRVTNYENVAENLFKIKLASDVDVSKNINFYRLRSSDSAQSWITGGTAFQAGTNLFKMTSWTGSNQWAGEWDGSWYVETLAGQTMAFENKSGADIYGVKARFYANTSNSAIATVDIGTVSDGAYQMFTIPENYGSYVQFISGEGSGAIILGDTFSNFLGEGVGESGVESFVYDSTTKYCYKYQTDDDDSTWGVPGDGTKITNAAELKAFLEGDGVVGILDASFACDTAITVKGDKTLNLNGKTITASTASLFTVGSGKSLTIIDPTDVTDSKTTADGDKYKRLGSLSGYELTYYVTESTASGTATTETLYKHTADFSSAGKIVSTSTGDNVIKVEGGTLNLEGGVISSNGSHAVVLSTSNGGTLNMSEGLIKGNAEGSADGSGIYIGNGTLNMTGGYIAGGRSGNGGGIYMNSGTINMAGGVIAANIGTDNGKGGGIYVNSGTLNLSDGVISGNQVGSGVTNGGGGVYMESGTINMTGGYVTNNVKYGGANDANGRSGGGGIAYNTAEMYMSGGYITGNYSEEAGGGVYAGYYHSSDSGARFVMSGGTIASNWAQNGEGGGLRIAGGVEGVISAPSGSMVYITNNTTKTTKDWGGGGIFVQTDGTFNILDVLITNNHAEGFGGGVASCPTGDVDAVSDKGAAIFGNKADCSVVRPDGGVKNYDVAFKSNYEQYGGPGGTNTSFNSSTDVQDYFCTNQKTAEQTMLGEGSEVWTGPGLSAGQMTNMPWNITLDGETHQIMALTANPTQEDKNAAIAAASVIITGNWSHTHGGGITTNGTLDMGKTNKTEVGTSLTISATKQVMKGTGNAQTTELPAFEFVLLNKKPAWNVTTKQFDYAEDTTVLQTKTNDVNGNIAFDKIDYNIAGYYTYYLIEKPIIGQGNYEQDATLYTIGVMVKSSTETSGTTKTTTYTIEKVELKLEQNGVTKGSKTGNVTGDGTDKTITITDLNGKTTFTNNEVTFYALPSTGGIGTTLYTLGGLLLMAVAEFFLLYNYKKRRKEDVASS